ncbi:hypothetical protein FEM48_Zijuj04G0141900 [Ziziphus jujuba var. spinosa]|uniref:25S rRNA (uridine-N(3))-methyltransferase BMT5-like domain-containing protein n=1 Tax=Ziziphus jujuba var. spinosa TaxID=714518 RepID=A0A978VKC2_ZIZJJ|nr:hypothetical protein FEM48_Zijuj04G0141900 [Ziziphus jujuba var. spinosa]
MDNNMEEKWIKHYSSWQKMLLVGEGNFSFSSCLARAFGSATNMVATSFDDKVTLLRRYGINCASYLEDLEERGCLVLHEVDVHDMNQHPTLKSMKFDVIIFNFPHAGHVSWLKERDELLIVRHRHLVRAFFESASELLKEDGEVHITHRDDDPYRQWKLEELCETAGFCLKEKVEFNKKDYPGYINKRGGNINGNVTFPLKDCSFTFKFCLQKSGSSLTSNDDDGYHKVREAIANEVSGILAELGSKFGLN